MIRGVFSRCIFSVWLLSQKSELSNKCRLIAWVGPEKVATTKEQLKWANESRVLLLRLKVASDLLPYKVIILHPTQILGSATFPQVNEERRRLLNCAKYL